MTLIFVEIKYTAIPVCAVATFAAIQEGHLIRMGKSDCGTAHGHYLYSGGILAPAL